jgi:hypothetical protein
MKLYIANCTQQQFNFVYRTLGQIAARQQMIEIGRQTRLSGEFTAEEIEYIVEQHAKYGLIRDTEVNSRRRGFNGLCYAVDRPVSVENMQIVMTFNSEALVEEGRRLRMEAAVATSTAIETEGQGLSALELSVVEEERPGHVTQVSEGLRVTRSEPHGQQAAPPTARARGGKGRK